MFRLIKLAIYGLLGYAIYEFIRGMTEGEGAIERQQGQGRGPGRGARELGRAMDRDAARTNMTGRGQVERVTSSEPSGESVPHRVGRGVVRR